MVNVQTLVLKMPHLSAKRSPLCASHSNPTTSITSRNNFKYKFEKVLPIKKLRSWLLSYSTLKVALNTVEPYRQVCLFCSSEVKQEYIENKNLHRKVLKLLVSNSGRQKQGIFYLFHVAMVSTFDVKDPTLLTDKRFTGLQ